MDPAQRHAGSAQRHAGSAPASHLEAREPGRHCAAGAPARIRVEVLPDLPRVRDVVEASGHAYPGGEDGREGEGGGGGGRGLGKAGDRKGREEEE